MMGDGFAGRPLRGMEKEFGKKMINPVGDRPPSNFNRQSTQSQPVINSYSNQMVQNNYPQIQQSQQNIHSSNLY
jgi:hypothetical protein